MDGDPQWAPQAPSHTNTHTHRHQSNFLCIIICINLKKITQCQCHECSIHLTSLSHQPQEEEEYKNEKHWNCNKQVMENSISEAILACVCRDYIWRLQVHLAVSTLVVGSIGEEEVRDVLFLSSSRLSTNTDHYCSFKCVVLSLRLLAPSG